MNEEERKKIWKYIQVDVPLEMHGCIKADEGAFLHDFIINENIPQIVETGSGVSTFFILRALQKLRGDRFLHSIDKFIFDKQPEYQSKDFSKREEWIIPIIKKEFSNVLWGFTKGEDSVEYIKKNIDSMEMDLFFHDSCHTFEHIRNEWLLVKGKVKWFASHNCGADFCQELAQSKEFIDEFDGVDCCGVLGIWKKKI